MHRRQDNGRTVITYAGNLCMLYTHMMQNCRYNYCTCPRLLRSADKPNRPIFSDRPIATGLSAFGGFLMGGRDAGTPGYSLWILYTLVATYVQAVNIAHLGLWTRSSWSAQHLSRLLCLLYKRVTRLILGGPLFIRPWASDLSHTHVFHLTVPLRWRKRPPRAIQSVREYVGCKTHLPCNSFCMPGALYCNRPCILSHRSTNNLYLFSVPYASQQFLEGPDVWATHTGLHLYRVIVGCDGLTIVVCMIERS